MLLSSSVAALIAERLVALCILACEPASLAPTVTASRLMLMVPWLKLGRFGARKALSFKAHVSRLGTPAGVFQLAAEACACDVLAMGAQSPSDKNR